MLLVNHRLCRRQFIFEECATGVVFHFKNSGGGVSFALIGKRGVSARMLKQFYLCAAYHQGCVPVMEQALDRDSTGIVEVLPALKVDAIASEELALLGFSERVFRNINTPADWETAQRELELTRR